MTKNKAIAELLLCSALWSIAGIFMKQIPWSGFVIAGLRSLLAGMVMAAFMLANKLHLTLNRRSLFGGLTLCVTMLFFSLANKTTTAANAIVLQFTDPIWIMVLSAVFLKKKFRRADVIAALLTFAGILLFFADDLGGGHLPGNCLALGSGLTFALYYMSLADCGEEVRTSAVLVANALTFLIGVPFMFTTGPVFSGTSVAFILILGICQLGIPYVLLAHASGWCPPLVCCLMGALEPLLNPVWVAIFDGEMPGLLALLGGIVVIATVTGWCIHDGKREKQER